jgi:hypothetical protein
MSVIEHSVSDSAGSVSLRVYFYFGAIISTWVVSVCKWRPSGGLFTLGACLFLFPFFRIPISFLRVRALWQNYIHPDGAGASRRLYQGTQLWSKEPGVLPWRRPVARSCFEWKSSWWTSLVRRVWSSPSGSVRDSVDSERTSSAIKMCFESVMDPASRCLAVIAETATVSPSRGNQDGYWLDASECYVYS